MQAVGAFAGDFSTPAGAHNDMGDIVFDTEKANDASPRIVSTDGGVYRNNNNADTPAWVQPTVTPHALWLFGMAGVQRPGAAQEDLYFSLQDDGLWATQNAGVALPAKPTWNNTESADSFSIVADATQIIYDNGFFPAPRALRLSIANAGGGGEVQFTQPDYPDATGIAANFQYIDDIAQFGASSYALVNGNGVFVTTNLTAANVAGDAVVWAQLGAATTPANARGVRVAMNGGTPTFFLLAGNGSSDNGNQLWTFVGTGAGNWTQIDNNLGPNAPGQTGRIGIFAVDPNNPLRIYASDFAPAGLRMVSSTNGGVNWNPDPFLDTLMTGGGVFRYQTQTGLSIRPAGVPGALVQFRGYAQPTLLAFDPNNGQNIVAGGTDSGVFFSNDGGASWHLITDPFTSNVSGIPHLPRPRFAHFNNEIAGTTQLYIGTVGRGVWRLDVNFDLPPDRFEPNNTIGTSTVLGSLPEVTERDLTIHNAADVDFYQYTAHDTGKLVTNIYFNSLAGQLDVRVRDARGNIIVASGTQTNIAPGRDRERLVIPVVAQQEYFVEVFSALGHSGEYDLEIENFAAPVPVIVDLDPSDDTGTDDTDDNTFDSSPHVRIQADLDGFATDGINIIANPTVLANRVNGAAVQMFVNGVSVGFATPIAATGNSLFEFTLSSAQLSANFPITPPAGPARGWLNFVTAAVTMFDNQRDVNGNSAPVSGRTELSDPLLLTFDPNAPAQPSIPDLLSTSDSAGCPGSSDTDNNTNINAPAFSGTGEMNTIVRIFANGVLVGEGRVGSDRTDGVLGNGLGAWEVTVEPLADGTYTITATLEDLAGNISVASGGLTGLTIDTTAPQRPTIDLADISDSGRNNKDNITNDLVTTLPGFLRFRVTSDPGTMVVIKDGNTVIDGPFAMGLADVVFRDIPTTMFPTDRDYILSAEANDQACNTTQSEGLIIEVDRTAPAAPTIAIDPLSSDTGVEGYPTTFTDRITSDTATGFTGVAEADTVVRLLANGVTHGLTVALPQDGNQAFPNGRWYLDAVRDLNDPGFFPFDGLGVMTATAEDRAGNVSGVGTLNIFIDTQGPQVTGVSIPAFPTFDLFDPKPLTAGPTPRVDSLTISLRDLPNRDALFLCEAIHAGVASQPGHYILRGDHNGIIPVSAVVVTNAAAVAGQPATATIELQFAAPLPDDRCTLTLSATLVDRAGNALDVENNAPQPLENPAFPTGDGQPGGDFVARFTVDSRPEIGTYSNGAVFLDINGNGYFDPAGADNDFTNRDLVFALGFDKLAAYDQGANPHRWVFDFDHNGTADLSVISGVQGSGDPFAGNWSAAHPGDEIGLFNGQTWFLDSNGNNNLDNGDLSIKSKFGSTGVGTATLNVSVLAPPVAPALVSNTPPAPVAVPFGTFGGRVVVLGSDMNGDGIRELIVAERRGGKGVVRIYNGSNGALLRVLRVARGAVQGRLRLDLRDLDGDGLLDLVARARVGGRTRTRILSGFNLLELPAGLAGKPDDGAVR